MGEKQAGKSIKKKVFRILLNIFLVVLSVPPALTFLFRDPMVQTLSARMITNFLTSQTGYEIRIERMKFNPASGISLYGMHFKDHRNLTLLAIDKLSAKPILGDIRHIGLSFRRIYLDGVEFRFARLADDEDYNLNILLDKFSLRQKNKDVEQKQSGAGFRIFASDLVLTNSVFHLIDEYKEYDNDTCVDYADMRFGSINLYARDFSMVGDSLSLLIDSLSTIEQSGFELKRLTAQFSIAKSGLYAKGTTIDLPRSRLDLDLEFRNKSYQTFAYFIDSVYMYGNFRPTNVDMSEIGAFAPQLISMENLVGFTGEVSGPVRDMRGKDLRLRFGQHTRIHCDARIVGLPDFYSSQITTTIHELTTTSCDVLSFRLPQDQQKLDFTREFDCDDIVQLKGTFNGSFYDFQTDLQLISGNGSMNADIAFTMLEPDTIHFQGILKGDSVNIGRLLQQEEILGLTNLDLTVKGSGNTVDDLAASVYGYLRSFDLLDYRYSRLRLNANYRKDSLNARVRFGDQNLMMDAAGYLKLGAIPRLAVQSSIRKANLDAIRLWPESGLTLSASADMKMEDFDLNTMKLQLNVSDAALDFKGDVYSLRKASLEKFLSPAGENMIKLNSDIADADLTGVYRITELPAQVMDALNSYYDFIPLEVHDNKVPGEYATFSINLKKTNLLEEQFLPWMEFHEPLLVEGAFENDRNRIRMLTSPRKLSLWGITLNENKVNLKAEKGKLDLTIDVADVIVKDSADQDSTVFGMDNFNLQVSAANDSLNYSIGWNNDHSKLRNKAELFGYLARDVESTRFSIMKSEIYINDTLWTLNPENRIVGDSSGLHFYDVDVYGGESKMSLSGKYPRVEDDLFRLSFYQWNLSNFDFLTRIYNIDFDGIANGNLEVGILSGNNTIISNLTIDDFYLNEEYLGTARLLNTWDNTNNSIFVKSQIIREGNVGRGEVFTVDGYYYPFREEESIDLAISFNRFNLTAIEPMVAEFVTRIEGQASGNLKLTGSQREPVLTGTIDMRRTGLKINYLNTRYSFSNTISFREDEIGFDQLQIFDTLGNYANVKGSLKHNHFRDPKFDVRINTDRLLFFNTTRKMNDLYYGRAITSGDISMSGSPSSIKLDMKAKTLDGTDVTLPLDYTLEISDKDYIIFLDPEEPDSLDMEIEPEGKAKTEELAYSIDLGMEIQQNARVRIFLPSDMGRIESQGNGDLSMYTNSNGDFTLRGDYVVENGTFNFSLGNLVSKRFDLVRGGRISWTGDPYTANLNIKGLYRVRTNLSSLGIVVDTTSDYMNKVNVNCYVILTNQLMNPDIRFEILFPNLDPDMRRRVYAELDTTNQAVLNEQMISLLVLGTFSASNATNISLASSYYSVLTNQLSSMLSRISDDFDLGINYRPGDNVSQEEFEVALSTQLFDDRLLIDGQVGMTYDRTQRNTSNIIGDVDIGYKLTRDGRWILKAFNHSNVNTWYSYGAWDRVAPYTQGIGIAYRKEFTNISELFRSSRPSRKEQARREEQAELENL